MDPLKIYSQVDFIYYNQKFKNSFAEIMLYKVIFNQIAQHDFLY